MSDETVYINPSEVLPPCQLKAHFDFLRGKGYVNFNGGTVSVSVQHKHPLDRLAGEEGILDDAQYHAGMKYKLICDCAGGRTQYQDSQEASSIAPIDPVLTKILIEKQLQRDDKHIIYAIVLRPVKEHQYSSFHQVSALIQNAFNSLADALQPDNIKNTLDIWRDKGYRCGVDNAIALSRISSQHC